LPAHRSRMVRNYLQTLNERIRSEFPPSYAPELNPVEYIWAYWKQHELPNVGPKDYWELSEAARRTLKRMRRRTRVMAAFWKQASLWTAGTILCGT
jgi:transposase